MIKESYSLPNAIHYVSDMKLRFLEPLSTNRHDLCAVAAAVSGESPDLGEAISEDFEASRRSDKSELGRPAALAPQTDLFARTRRAAGSSGIGKTVRSVGTACLDTGKK